MTSPPCSQPAAITSSSHESDEHDLPVSAPTLAGEFPQQSLVIT